MGQQDVPEQLDDRRLRSYTKALLDDVLALERMLEGGTAFETDIRRIGAEQEMFLVDSDMDPAPKVTEVLEKAQDARLTTELARFNIEANLSPQLFGGDCLRRMEEELNELLGLVRTAAQSCGSDILLAGILPTLRQSDLSLDNMTPNPRYHALNREMSRLRGGDFRVSISGLDELEATHDNVMLESCNTSFQVHFQVAPDEFARFYNIAQAVTGPVLAAACNSPVLLGHRLWSETRVALFQHSVDTRSSTHQARGGRPRVSFGDAWVDESVLEIFREDIVRFRSIIATEGQEDPLRVLNEGRLPQLSALRLHNGTVYRWNRPCYGLSGNGKAHLRIENRVLPAGPTVIDEVANAAFFFGLMSAMLEEHGDIRDVLQFDDAKHNFDAAARTGLRAQMHWTDGQSYPARELITEHLLPAAREGLKAASIDDDDISRYLGVIGDRVRSLQTGSNWAFHSLSEMGSTATKDVRHRTLARTIFQLQRDGRPIHEWPLAKLGRAGEFKKSSKTVAHLMSPDVFTVRPEDLVDLAASLMEWEHVRHVPVEDDGGRLVGVVSQRALLRLVSRGLTSGEREPVAVSKIMRANPVTVEADCSALDAMRLMRKEGVGCLPVVEGDRLVGIVTEHDFIELAGSLLEQHLADDEPG
ncbi:MAG: glutamate-cysteine ligase family protein [Acidobacteriota bacterium]